MDLADTVTSTTFILEKVIKDGERKYIEEVRSWLRDSMEHPDKMFCDEYGREMTI